MIPGSDLLSEISNPPKRVVSLVPSITESLFDLGFGKTIIGITDYCCEPKGLVDSIQRIGGTKSIDVERIISLHPDLVIANQEENDRDQLAQLDRLGMPVWLTFPKTVRCAINDLYLIASLFRSEMAVNMVRSLEKQYELLEYSLEDQKPTKYFCPIWESNPTDSDRWWMTFNDETYCGDIIRLNGGLNCFSTRQRRYPIAADLGRGESEPAGERDTRYPRVSLAEVEIMSPEVILLPDEPFAYSHKDIDRFLDIFRDTPAGKNRKIRTIDGKLITWAGTHMRFAFEELFHLLD